MGANLMSLARSGGKFLKLFGDRKMMKPLPYDAEVEWIKTEPNGGQCILTGVDLDVSDGFEIRAKVSYDSEYSDDNVFLGTEGNYALYLNTGRGNYPCARVGSIWRFGQTISAGFHTYKTIIKGASECYMQMDGADLQPSTIGSNSLGNKGELGIFFNRGVQAFYSKGCSCGFLFMKVGEMIARDFIAVRFTNENGVSEGAMYDCVSGELFRNAGTGAFIIGPDKTT